MIVRETPDAFIMIEQAHHARLAGDIMKNVQSELIADDELKSSVLLAIANHDIGWHPFDTQPFYNDAKHAPFTFLDFPSAAKVVLYKDGIDQVATTDAYAGLLCSKHYVRFMENDAHEATKDFVKKEIRRQNELIDSIPEFDKEMCDFHFAVLRFADNLSLYLCLNEPGTSKANEHPFFRDGLSVPEELHTNLPEKIGICWQDEQTIKMNQFPFTADVHVYLMQKKVRKADIATYGLLKSYEIAPTETVQIQLSEG